jgi:hypothetical protein
MYRVYQACDSAAKQNASRTAQACVRNAFAQRAMKPSFKSIARINKDAMMKGKRVVKEVSCSCFLGLDNTAREEELMTDAGILEKEREGRKYRS